MFHRVVAPGLELRQFQLADAALLFSVVDRDRARLREWLPWVDRTHSPADIRLFIEASLEQWNTGHGPNSGVWLDGALIGALGCHRFDLDNRNCSIGYWIEAGHQGQGIITRCAAALIDYLFSEAALHRVEIRCGTGNHRSCAVPQRLGFTREGVLNEAEWVNTRWIDLVVWSMLHRNWTNPWPSASIRGPEDPASE